MCPPQPPVEPRRQSTDEIIRLAHEAMAIFRPRGDLCGEGIALNGLALAYLIKGEPDRARAGLEKSCEIWQHLDSYYGHARALAHLGLATHAVGDLHEAIRVQQEALAMIRQVNDTSFIPIR